MLEAAIELGLSSQDTLSSSAGVKNIRVSIELEGCAFALKKVCIRRDHLLLRPEKALLRPLMKLESLSLEVEDDIVDIRFRRRCRFQIPKID